MRYSEGAMPRNTNSEIYIARGLLGWEQRELAKVLGVHKVTVSRWENDHHAVPEPTLRLVRLIVRAERVDLASPDSVKAALVKPVAAA